MFCIWSEMMTQISPWPRVKIKYFSAGAELYVSYEDTKFRQIIFVHSRDNQLYMQF